MRNLFFVFLFLLSPVFLWSQPKTEPPVPLEILFGNNRIYLSSSLNKAIAGKWRYLSVASAAADYKNRRSETEIVINNWLLYQFHPNFGASAGIQYHYYKGLVPNISFHAAYASPTWRLMFTPSFGMLPHESLKASAIVEFKPALSQRLRLYTKAQLLYDQNTTDNLHDRSQYYFRLGLTIRKFTFGGGVNFDYYGPNYLHKNNWGGFLLVNI